MKTRRGRILSLITLTVSVAAFAAFALWAASEDAWLGAAFGITVALLDAIRLGALIVEWTEPK